MLIHLTGKPSFLAFLTVLLGNILELSTTFESLGDTVSLSASLVDSVGTNLNLAILN